MFESRGRSMPENNLRQAEMPQGARFIAEMPGTAPGLVCPVGAQVIYAVPGVPSEMRAMMTGTILPDLRARSGETSVIRSRVLRTWGQSESGLAEMLAEHMHRLDESGRATLAFQASGIEGIKVRITVKAPDEAAAQALLETEDQVVSDLLGKYVFGRDRETMESVVLVGLRQRGLTLALAESATGGHIGLRLSARDEADGVFRGGVILGDGDLQTRLLGVPVPDSPNAETAAALAAAVRREAGVDIGLSTCSVDDRTPVSGLRTGTVFIGIATEEGARIETVQLPGDRARIREYAVISALNALRQRVLT
jgi:nicotinamide-nucleotide amidase